MNGIERLLARFEDENRAINKKRKMVVTHLPLILLSLSFPSDEYSEVCKDPCISASPLGEFRYEVA
jgi:hypothetical protein